MFDKVGIAFIMMRDSCEAESSKMPFEFREEIVPILLSAIDCATLMLRCDISSHDLGRARDDALETHTGTETRLDRQRVSRTYWTQKWFPPRPGSLSRVPSNSEATERIILVVTWSSCSIMADSDLI